MTLAALLDRWFHGAATAPTSASGVEVGEPFELVVAERARRRRADHPFGEVDRPICPGTPGGGHGSIDATELEALLTEAALLRADTTNLGAMVRAEGRKRLLAATLVRELEALDQSHPFPTCIASRPVPPTSL